VAGDLVFTVHSALNAGPYWSYGTPLMLLDLALAGTVLGLAAWAASHITPSEPTELARQRRRDARASR
jgi:hypothetical protein